MTDEMRDMVDEPADGTAVEPEVDPVLVSRQIGRASCRERV